MTITWGKFYGVGVGPGDPRLLTLQAVDVLQSVDLVAIPKSKLDRESVAWDIAKIHCPPNVRLVELEMPMTADQQVLLKAWQDGAQTLLAELKQGKSVAFITLGDPSLYSTYSYLLNILQAELPQECIVTVPGITAMSAAAARINLPLATGDEPLLILPSTEDVGEFLHFPNLVLMKVSRRLPEILTLLAERGRKAVLLTRLGQSGEKIRWEPKPQDFTADKIDYLSLLLVKKDLLGRENSEPEKTNGEVIFVGAGPGDPELITVKGSRALERADRVIYAGSLVNPELLGLCRRGTPVQDSAHLTLEEVVALMDEGTRRGETIVRLHTGDPSMYGAIMEQFDYLDKQSIPYSVIPGVSSVFAAAAAVKREFTLPDISQTLILTRLAGRTPVPEREALANLAKHQASMAIFLSVQDMHSVVEALLEGGYPASTPIAVISKASWPEEEILQGTLDTIVEKVELAGIRKQAQILVGDFLDPANGYARSKLYNPTFTHEYRQGTAK